MGVVSGTIWHIFRFMGLVCPSNFREILCSTI